MTDEDWEQARKGFGDQDLAAAVVLDADVMLSSPSPQPQDALSREGRRCSIVVA